MQNLLHCLILKSPKITCLITFARSILFSFPRLGFILSNSLLLLSTASEESNIYPQVRYAILKLSHGMVFDFEDCFLRTKVFAAELPFTYKPYAPWLQAICNYGRAEDFIARHHPKLFSPPARDTLNILRQPSNPFNTYVGIRQDVNDRNLSKQFQKECHHFEFHFAPSRCSRTSSKPISAKCNS